MDQRFFDDRCLDDGASVTNPEWRAEWYRALRPFAKLAVELSPHLARATNRIDLDLLLPERIMIETVEDGLVVKGLLKLRQAPRGARVRPASDAPGPLPPRLMPGWPSLLWQVEASDDKLDYVIELSYGGIRFDGPESALRLVQWHGRTVRDVTTQVDRDRRVVIGHASGPGTFGILAHLARG